MNKAVKITAIIIVSAMLVSGVALAICGVIYAANKESIAVLKFLDNAGVDEDFICEILDCVDGNYEILAQYLSGEIPLSNQEFCRFVTSVFKLSGRLKSRDLGDAVYGYLHDSARFCDVGLIGKYSSLFKYKDLFKKLSQFGQGDFAEKLSIIKAFSYYQIQAISSQFVTLCDYVFSSGASSLSYNLDVLSRAVQYKEDLSERVSLREIFTCIKYISQGLSYCDDLDVTLGALYQAFGYQVLDVLSHAPQLINSTLSFLSDVEIGTLSDVISYTFYPNVCVALFHTLDKENFLSDINVEKISNEISGILTRLEIDDIDFKEFYFELNRLDERGEYLFDPQDLTQEQEEYVCGIINPIIDYVKFRTTLP